MKQTLPKQVLTNQVLISLCSFTPILAHLFIKLLPHLCVLIEQKNSQIFVNIQKTLLNASNLPYLCKSIEEMVDNWVFHAKGSLCLGRECWSSFVWSS